MQTITKQAYITDNDIVPDDVQNVLIYWRDVFRGGYFSIGDIANDMIERGAIKGIDVPHPRMYSAVGRFVGKSGRTIRHYAETAAFFPQAVRVESGFDVLPFAFFVFAKTMGVQWRDVLEYAAEKPEITTAGLRMNFCGVAVGSNSKDCLADKMRVITPFQDSECTPATLPVTHTKSVGYGTLGQVRSALSDLGHVINGVEMDEQAKTDLRNNIKSIVRMLPKLASLLNV